MRNNLIKKVIEQELGDKNLIYPFIGKLTQKEKDILSFREQKPKKSLNFIGKKFNLSRERIRQIQKKANAKIEYQKKIINQLAERLNEYLFTEDEIERAFKKLNAPKKLDYATFKLKWQVFIKILWKLKQDERQ